MKLFILPLLACIALLTSCGSTLSYLKSHEAFEKRRDYKKTSAIFKSEQLAQTSHKDSRVLVNKTTQRIQLIDKDKVVLDAPCSTGREGKYTPVGNFKITEKITNKRSTIYGTCYKDGVKVWGGDRRQCNVRYNKYVGEELPYWQRLTQDGIGLHSSNYVDRQPRSNGCVRIEPEIAQLIYQKTNKGTIVSIVN